MAYNSLIMPCLALRRTDTIETLSKTQQRYQLLASEVPDQVNVIHTSINLQKKNTGLSGLMCEIQGTSLLNAADMLTEEVFRGISVVKCNVDELQAIAILQRKDDLVGQLNQFLTAMQTTQNNTAGMLLDQIMPSGEAHDFWWFGQTCELKGGSTTRDCILHDGKRGDVIFYDAFSCIERSGARACKQDAGADQSFRDACVWEPVLHGSLGIYTQRAGDGNSIFFVCISDFEQIASDIVRSTKSDLGNSTNVYDFCSSTEMWFLENISRRNRLRLIQRTAAHLGICVPQKPDLYAHPKQAASNLAIECCGVNLDHIECTHRRDILTQKLVPIVRHYKDCTDMTHSRGPVPVFLGDEIRVLLLLPDKTSYASFANYSDTLQFIQNKTGCTVHLCPLLNVREQNRANIRKIQTEQQNIVHVTIPDLIYDLQQQGLQIQPHVYDLLMSTDEYGNFLFYGVQLGVATPSVIYPRVFPGFVRATATVKGDEVATEEHTRRVSQDTTTLSAAPEGASEESQVSVQSQTFIQPNDIMLQQMHQSTLPVSKTSLSNAMATQNVQKHRDVCEVMCDSFACIIQENQPDTGGPQPAALFDFRTQQGADDPAYMSLEWSELTIDLVQKMTRMPQIDTMNLLPHAIFSNYFEG